MNIKPYSYQSLTIRATMQTIKAVTERSCFACGVTTTKIWIHNYDPQCNSICHPCYLKYIYQPIQSHTCIACGETKIEGRWTVAKDDIGNESRLCRNCYNRHIANPIYNQLHSKERITYKGRDFHLGKNPRIGVCNFCRAVAGEINTQTGKLIKRTALHHEDYNDNAVLDSTIELCTGCHTKMSAELGQLTRVEESQERICQNCGYGYCWRSNIRKSREGIMRRRYLCKRCKHAHYIPVSSQ